MDKGISHVLSMSILLYGLRRPIFNSQDKEPYSFVELKAQEKTGLLLMPTAKVTKNVSAAEGGGNVLCSILISIKTKAWLYSFRSAFVTVAVPASFTLLYSVIAGSFSFHFPVEENFTTSPLPPSVAIWSCQKGSTLKRRFSQ